MPDYSDNFNSQQSSSPIKNFTMDAGTVLVISLVASFIWLWIIYEIIKSATKSTRQLQFSEMQVRLLAELLIKQGTPVDRIMEIVNLEKKYFKELGSKKV